METIGVIGIGKLGLGFALLLAKKYKVIGVDINQEYVNSLNDKTFKSIEPGYNELLNNTTQFTATTDITQVFDSRFIFILVQTPNGGGEKFYDHTILSNVLEKLNTYKLVNKHLIIGCTVMPGYINNIGKHLLSDSQVTLSYNPEFVAQGEVIHGFKNPDLILCGTESKDVKDFLIDIYIDMADIKHSFCCMTPLEAEIVKISLNGFITTKISYANTIADLCDTLGANKQLVLDSIGRDSRIGNKYFRPGFSYGGPCFPRDTKAVKRLLDQNGIMSDLLSATTRSNEFHIAFQTQQLLDAKLNEYTFDNVCYKNSMDLPLIEESATLKIARNLVKSGKQVLIRGTTAIIQEVKKEYGNMFKYKENNLC
jgi:nucleotide sugar dehydrogenase